MTNLPNFCINRHIGLTLFILRRAAFAALLTFIICHAGTSTAPLGCLLLCLLGNPVVSVAEDFDPRSNIIAHVGRGISSTLPGEDCTLGVRHQCHVTAVGTCKRSHVVCRTVGVTGVLAVCVACNNIVLLLGIGKIELALTVSNPNAKAAVR